MKIINGAGLLAGAMILAMLATTAPVLGRPDAATHYYVDAAVPASGNGLSWATAFKTIKEATQADLQPGATVWIRPGVYHESFSLKKSGASVVTMTSGVTLSHSNRVTLPPGVNLAGIDLGANPGEYVVYVARSWRSNNGVFTITGVNAAQRYVTVDVAGQSFVDETGVAGDLTRVSAAVGRPIVFRKYSANPAVERVTVDVSGIESSGIYIGKYKDPYDADPVDFNIVDGLDVTGSYYSGYHAQSSSYNVIRNAWVYSTSLQGVGILINGNADRPARYNYLIGNRIFNTPYEGVYIGAGGQPVWKNHTHFNHVIDNEIFTQGTGDLARMENAVDLKEYNQANVVEGNLFRDFNLYTTNNGALDVRNEAHDSLIYGNTFRNISRRVSGTNHIVNFYPDIQRVAFFNNVIYRQTALNDGVYAINLSGNNTVGVSIYHNTIHNIRNGLLLRYFTSDGTGSDLGVRVENNLFSGIAGAPVTEWTWNNAQGGHFTLVNNLWPSQPDAPYNTAAPAYLGAPSYANAGAGDLHLTPASRGIDLGSAVTPAVALDFDRWPRNDGQPDLGAFEYYQLSRAYLPIAIR